MCTRCIVTGRVQGVFFRDTTRRRAYELGVKGHAINLSDGSVEVVACGDGVAVSQLRDWLWEGSTMASVGSVNCETVDCRKPDKFSTG